MKPKQYFWKIESAWDQYFSESKRPSSLFAFSEIEQTADEKLSFEESDDCVFFDEHEKGYKGLKKYSHVLQSGKPIFLVDNHHEVLLPFFSVFCETQTPLTVVHIDAHRDDAIFTKETQVETEMQRLSEFFAGEAGNMEDAQKDMQVFKNACRVCDYLDAGKKVGLIDSVISLTQSSEFESFRAPKHPFVLNLDIDIFGEEGDMVPDILKVKTIAASWSACIAVCIATSPGFIDKEHGKRIIEIFTA